MPTPGGATKCRSAEPQNKETRAETADWQQLEEVPGAVGVRPNLGKTAKGQSAETVELEAKSPSLVNR